MHTSNGAGNSTGQINSRRKNKGKSLLETFNEFVAIDLETTGLDPRCDDIIELAAARIKDGVVLETYQSLVNPGYEIDEFITKLTGITNEMLLEAPRLPDVLKDYISFIGNSVVLAHNANFDINFIYDKCADLLSVDFKNDFIDTMRISRRLFPEYRHHRLIDLVNRFNIADSVEHRALSDATKAYQCYERMKKHMLDNGIVLQAKYYKTIPAKDISTTKTSFDCSSPIYDKVFVFTGALEKMARRTAMQAVVDMGGMCADNITKKTNYLVLGNNDYCTSIRDGKSGKQKKAEKYKLAGIDIETISERVFYDMLSQNEE